MFTVIAINAFGIAGVAVSLFDFGVVQRRPLLNLDPVGVATFALGLTVELSARRALGKEFAITVRTTAEQRLVQSGLYRFVRHPLYLGVIVLYFSAPIAWQSAYGALVILPIIPFLLRRISIEEEAMALRFGDEWMAYARRTRRLIPLIY